MQYIADSAPESMVNDPSGHTCWAEEPDALTKNPGSAGRQWGGRDGQGGRRMRRANSGGMHISSLTRADVDDGGEDERACLCKVSKVRPWTVPCALVR